MNDYIDFECWGEVKTFIKNSIGMITRTGDGENCASMNSEGRSNENEWGRRGE